MVCSYYRLDKRFKRKNILKIIITCNGCVKWIGYYTSVAARTCLNLLHFSSLLRGLTPSRSLHRFSTLYPRPWSKPERGSHSPLLEEFTLRQRWLPPIRKDQTKNTVWSYSVSSFHEFLSNVDGSNRQQCGVKKTKNGPEAFHGFHSKWT